MANVKLSKAERTALDSVIVIALVLGGVVLVGIVKQKLSDADILAMTKYR